METTRHTVGSVGQEGSKVSEQQHSFSQNIITQPPTSQPDMEQRRGYEMQDCCADSCYCIGFIFTLGLISLCCQPDDMY